MSILPTSYFFLPNCSFRTIGSHATGLTLQQNWANVGKKEFYKSMQSAGNNFLCQFQLLSPIFLRDWEIDFTQKEISKGLICHRGTQILYVSFPNMAWLDHLTLVSLTAWTLFLMQCPHLYKNALINKGIE